MTQVRFESLDLNLLRVFDAVFTERSVTKAAQRLGLSQSAISHSLARLRYSLRDELFIRSSSGMTPTLLAHEIGPTVHQLLYSLRSALSASAFDPSQSQHIFSIACGDYTTSVLLPKVLARVMEVAPSIHIRILPMHPSNADLLEEGRLDLLIAHFGKVENKFQTEILVDDRIVCVMRHDHPAARDELTVRALAKLPLIFPSYGIGEDEQSDHSVMQWRGIELHTGWYHKLIASIDGGDEDLRSIKTSVRLISLLGAIDIARDTDYVAIVPARIAEDKARHYQLAIRELPFTTEFGTGLQMLAHRAHGSTPAVLWLREIFQRVAAELEDRA